MNLFQLIDEGFCINKTFFIKENTVLYSKRIGAVPISINKLKKATGSTIVLPIAYRGELELKVGVRRDSYSYAWIYEKHLSSKTWAVYTCNFDISAFSDGEIELTFIALSDCLISDAIPSSDDGSSSSEIDNEVAPIPRDDIPATEVLYPFISPTYSLCCEEPLYYRFSGGDAYYSFNDRAVHMKPLVPKEKVMYIEKDTPENGLVHVRRDASVDLLTYFNSFSACKWHKYTNVEDLSAYIDFCGNVEIELVHRDSTYELTLRRYIVKSKERATFELPIGHYPHTGILGIKIYAKKNSCLYGGGWLSTSPLTQDVHLGIGITTFKREDAIRNTVRRLSKEIAAHPVYHDLIDITVVDNGQTLRPEDVVGATLIPNRNLGGTGGFTRSLIHYQDTGKHTHCLFMDDDASCEASSIFRSMTFMRHAIDKRSALSGAMLFENLQFLQWENGAWFDGGCHSLKRAFDLRDPAKLVENEEEPTQRIYGAWWFFFFPISQAKNYTLPFFVRGDDIDFSYVNDFNVISMNGVCCWQQDFSTKENGSSVYLFLRSHIVHHLTIPQLERPFMTVAKFLCGHFVRYSNSYMYGTASCVNLAIRHVLKGPRFWEENIIPLEIFKKVKELCACEKAEPYTEDEKNSLILAKQEFLTRLAPIGIRKFSFYGHLLPSCFIKHTPRDMVYKPMTPDKAHAYRRDQLIVIDELNHKKILLKRDPLHYFMNFFEFLALLTILKLRYKKLRQIYRDGTKHQRTREFWTKQFRIGE